MYPLFMMFSTNPKNREISSGYQISLEAPVEGKN